MSNTSTTSIVDEIEQDDDEGFPLKVTIPVGIVISLMILLAVSGNILTIAAYVRDVKLRTVYNLYITNLAVTDLLMGLVSMPYYAVYTLKNYAWPFGYHFCKVYMVIDFTLCLESVLMVVIISLDRLLLLKYGPYYERKVTMKKATILLAVSWIISFLLYSPAIIGWDLWTGENTNEEGDCDVQFAYDVIFTTTTAVIEFVLPFVAIATLNVLIYLNIRRRTAVHAQMTSRPEQVNTAQPSKVDAAIFTTANPANKQETRTRQNGKENFDRKNMKAAKFLAALVIVFAVTWAPYTVATIIIAVCGTCVDENVYEFLNWLLWSKASVNPFLYAMNSARFLHNFKQMLWCFKCLYTKEKRDKNATTLSTDD